MTADSLIYFVNGCWNLWCGWHLYSVQSRLSRYEECAGPIRRAWPVFLMVGVLCHLTGLVLALR